MFGQTSKAIVSAKAMECLLKIDKKISIFSLTILNFSSSISGNAVLTVIACEIVSDTLRLAD
jgi:hypothetical protein